MELNFKVDPKGGSKKEELYPDKAVLTILKKPEEKGKTFRFSLNKRAAEELKLSEEDNVSFATNEHGDLMLVNVRDKDVPNKLRVTKSHTFSNKKMYEYVAALLTLNCSIDNNLELEFVEEHENMYVCKIKEIKSDDDSSEHVEDLEENEENEVEQVLEEYKSEMASDPEMSGAKEPEDIFKSDNS